MIFVAARSGRSVRSHAVRGAQPGTARSFSSSTWSECSTTAACGGAASSRGTAAASHPLASAYAPPAAVIPRTSGTKSERFVATAGCQASSCEIRKISREVRSHRARSEGDHARTQHGIREGERARHLQRDNERERLGGRSPVLLERASAQRQLRHVGRENVAAQRGARRDGAHDERADADFFVRVAQRARGEREVDGLGLDDVVCLRLREIAAR